MAVVGIGADGWAGLSPVSRAAVSSAEVILGSRRQLELLGGHGAGHAELIEWPSPLLPALPGLFERLAGRRLCALASGDPMLYGLVARCAGCSARTGSRCTHTCRRCRWPAPGCAGQCKR